MNAKQRWSDCRIIAEHLGCGKTHVHDRLYSRIKREELLNDAIGGVPTAIETIQSWPEFNERERENHWQPNPEVRGGAERLKLALWFITKIGSVEKAKRAVDLAVQVLEELD